ncbi:DUF5685 family protein [Nocardia amikacinitolerans]|uniref:DUF5685 family protein n=1 Tax=Nocardia amikacinitolerans TaxID=756689 RepID=UPI000AE0BA42|nr:DUF5685 family protein [Nocardia amikacinitolerans]
MLRPCSHGAEKYGIDAAEWRAHMCGLCLGLRDGHGQLARTATNTDAILLSVLTEAQLPAPSARTTAGRCPLRGMRRAEVAAADSPGVLLASTASLLLGSAKLRDHVADGDASRIAGRPMARMSTRWADSARRQAALIDFDVEPLVAAIDSQQLVESRAAALRPAPRPATGTAEPRGIGGRRDVRAGISDRSPSAVFDPSTASGELPVSHDRSATSGELPVSLDRSTVSGELPVSLDRSTVSGELPVSLDRSTVSGELPVSLDRSTVSGELPVSLDRSAASGEPLVTLDPNAASGEPLVMLDPGAASIEPPVTLDELTAPAALCAAELFAHTAILANRPENADQLRTAGRHFGRIAHLSDAIADYDDDTAHGRFNPLAATGTTLAESYELVRESDAELRRALAAARLADVPTIRWMLLDPLHALVHRLGKGIGAVRAHACNVSRADDAPVHLSGTGSRPSSPGRPEVSQGSRADCTCAHEPGADSLSSSPVRLQLGQISPADYTCAHEPGTDSLSSSPGRLVLGQRPRADHTCVHESGTDGPSSSPGRLGLGQISHADHTCTCEPRTGSTSGPAPVVATRLDHQHTSFLGAPTLTEHPDTPALGTSTSCPTCSETAHHPRAHRTGHRPPTRRPNLGQALTIVLGVYCTGYACCADHTSPCTGERKDAWWKSCDCGSCCDCGECCSGCGDCCSCGGCCDC